MLKEKSRYSQRKKNVEYLSPADILYKNGYRKLSKQKENNKRKTMGRSVRKKEHNKQKY